MTEGACDTRKEGEEGEMEWGLGCAGKKGASLGEADELEGNGRLEMG